MVKLIAFYPVADSYLAQDLQFLSLATVVEADFARASADAAAAPLARRLGITVKAPVAAALDMCGRVVHGFSYACTIALLAIVASTYLAPGHLVPPMRVFPAPTSRIKQSGSMRCVTA